MKIGNPTTAGAKLVPKSMTVGEISAMTSIPVGTIVYNSTYGNLQYWTGTEWHTQYYSINGSNGISTFASAPGFLTIIGPTIPPNDLLIAGVGIELTYPAPNAVVINTLPIEPVAYTRTTIAFTTNSNYFLYPNVEYLATITSGTSKLMQPHSSCIVGDKCVMSVKNVSTSGNAYLQWTNAFDDTLTEEAVVPFGKTMCLTFTATTNTDTFHTVWSVS